MQNRIYKSLPWAALLGIVIVVVCMVLITGMREQIITDTGETTSIVNQSLTKIEQLSPSNAEDAGLRKAVEELHSSPYVSSVWLIDPQGKILYSEGSTAFQGSIQDRISNDFNGILASIPADTLTADQSLLLSSAYAIQAEGEHNDIYRHQVREVLDSSGNLVAVIGIAYDTSTGDQASASNWKASILIFLFGICLYWLSLPVWTFMDAKRNGEPAWVWAVFVLMGNVIALIAYLLIKSASRKLTVS